MFSLSISFGPNGTLWGLLFKTEERASEVRAILAAILPSDDVTAVSDDFGQLGVFRGSEIHGMMMEDLDQSALGQTERTLHDQRVKARIMQRIQADPALRAAHAMANSPAMLQPMMNSHPRFQG